VRSGSLLAGLVLWLAIGAGCRAEGDAPQEFDDPQYEGVSLEEMELQAEAMSPEEAERLGIIDTTIQITPMNPDSLLPDEGGLMPPPTDQP
jgi:hypothetical protein